MLKKLYAHLFCQPRMGRRIVVLVLSLTLMGACVAVFDQIGFGTDPCTLLNLSIAENVLGWKTLGSWQLIFNALLTIIILLLREGKRIGLGTLINMVLVGYSKDFFDWVLNRVYPLTDAPLSTCLIAFVPSMVLFLIAVAFYIVVALGVSPFDAVPQIITDRLPKVPPMVIRMCYDLLAVLIGWLLGGTVGAVTIITGFCLGPVLAAITKKFRPLFR